MALDGVCKNDFTISRNKEEKDGRHYCCQAFGLHFEASLAGSCCWGTAQELFVILAL